MGLLALLGLQFLPGSTAQAHPETAPESGDSSPLMLLNTDGPTSARSRLSFGYFGGGSEADDYRIFNAECPAADPNPTRTPVCVRGANETFEEILVDSARLLLFQRMKEKAFELSVLNRMAFASPRPDPSSIPRPDCISESSDVWRRIQGGLTDDVSLGRIEATRGAYSNRNMALALLHNQRLQAASRSLGCWQTPRPPGNDAECNAILREEARLQSGYPGLWSSFSSRGAALTFSELSGVAEARAGMYALIGRAGRSEEVAASESATERGQTLAQQAFARGRLGYDSLVAGLDRSLTAADSDLTPPERNARSAFSSLAETVRQRTARDAEAFTCGSYEGFLRSEADMSRSVVITSMLSPNIVRQALLDATPVERTMMLRALCTLRLGEGRTAIETLRPTTNCEGVSRDSSREPPVVRVNRNSMDEGWPMRASTAYEIVQPVTAASPTILRLPVSLVIPDDEREAFEATRVSWAQDLNQYFNCQSGALTPAPEGLVNYSASCPPDPTMARTPPIRFEVEFTLVSPTASTPSEPRLNVSRCFHHDLNSTDCAAIRQYRITRCIERPSTPEECESTVPPVGDLRNNRENAANLSSGSSLQTLRHEIAHKMGLMDEYTSPPYDRILNPAGEHDSLLNRHTATNSRLYPRHLDQILSVQSCMAAQPRYMPEEL